ncbi:MAG: hypothetical protein ACXV5D_09400 [Halobacteriota archaeon]
MIRKVAVVVFIVMMTSLSIAGCTSSSTSNTSSTSGTNVTDYSDHYNKAMGDWIIEKPFYKTTSDRGNDLYMGVARNASSQYSHTLAYEHVKTEDDATVVFDTLVTQAQDSGYTEKSMPQDPHTVDAWRGVKTVGSTTSVVDISYYHASSVNSWVVQKENW